MGNIKLGIIKVTAEGEQCNIEMDVAQGDIPKKPGETFDEALVAYTAPYFKLMDNRLFEMNCRILGSNELVKRLTPEAAQAMHSALEVLMGRAPKSEIDQLVKEGQQRREKEHAEALARREKGKPTTH